MVPLRRDAHRPPQEARLQVLGPVGRRARQGARAPTATSGGTSPCTSDGTAEAASTIRSRGCVEELKRNPMSRRLVVTRVGAGQRADEQAAALPPASSCSTCSSTRRGDPLPLPPPHAAQRRRRARRPVQHRRLRLPARALLALHRASAPASSRHTLIDAHVYTAKADGSMAEYDHVPGLRRQLTRTPRALPQAAHRSRHQVARRPRAAARGGHRDGDEALRARRVRPAPGHLLQGRGMTRPVG